MNHPLTIQNHWGLQVASVITQAARAAMELDERMKQAVAGGFSVGGWDPLGLRGSKVRERRVWRARIFENWKISSFE